jgi:hypothetical protein
VCAEKKLKVLKIEIEDKAKCETSKNVQYQLEENIQPNFREIVTQRKAVEKQDREEVRKLLQRLRLQNIRERNRVNDGNIRRKESLRRTPKMG